MKAGARGGCRCSEAASCASFGAAAGRPWFLSVLVFVKLIEWGCFGVDSSANTPWYPSVLATLMFARSPPPESEPLRVEVLR